MAAANLQTVILWSAVAFAVYCALLLLARSARLIARRRRPRQTWQDRLRQQPKRHAAAPVFFAPEDAPEPVAPAPSDPAGQLSLVRSADFARRRVMEGGVDRVLQVVEQEIGANWPGFRVLPQTALAEVVETHDRRAQDAIRGARIDVLVTDADGLALAALDVVPGKTGRRADPVVRHPAGREALSKAGIACLDVQDYHTDSDIARMVRETLHRATRQRLQDTLPEHRQSA